MVIVKCLECGKEYELEQGEKLSDFECTCGGNLAYKQISLEKPKIVKRSRKKISIPLISLILIFSLILVVNSGLVHVYPINNQINNSNNTTQSSFYIANKTYSSNGLTFNYPAGWQPITNLSSPSRWGYGDPIVAFYQPNNYSDESNIDTYFYIKQRNVGSLEDQLSYYRSDIAEIGQTEVSERNITVNGMRAVELIKTWRNGDVQYMALTVHIEAIPGSLYYRIGCVTPADKFNATLPDFELIVNSFKLQ